MTSYRLPTIFQKKKFSFSEKTAVAVLFWFIAALFVALIVVDGFIFYRYSYTVLNAVPAANVSEVGLDKQQVNQAAVILEERQVELQKLLRQ